MHKMANEILLQVTFFGRPSYPLMFFHLHVTYLSLESNQFIPTIPTPTPNHTTSTRIMPSGTSATTQIIIIQAHHNLSPIVFSKIGTILRYFSSLFNMIRKRCFEHFHRAFRRPPWKNESNKSPHYQTQTTISFSFRCFHRYI